LPAAQAPALAAPAEAELLVRAQLARRVGVLHLADVDVLRPQARLLERRAPPASSGRRRRVVQAGERRVLAEDAAGQVRAQRRGGAFRRCRHARADDRRRALVGRAQHEERQRIAHHGATEHLLDE
jgi:hypothetical protein